MSNLKQQLIEDMKSAMRAKETIKLATLRLLIAAIKDQEINNQHTELDDTAVLATIEKLCKQRKDSINSYVKAGRDDLAAKEQQEIAVLTNYLPAKLSAEDTRKEIEQIILHVGASSMKDMGKVMSAAKIKLAGKADFALVSQLIKQKLTN